MGEIEVIATMVVAAFLTAAISGTLGMGGGVTLIAVMAVVLPAPIVVPIHAVIQLASNTTRIGAFRKHVNWRIVGWYAPLSILGVGVAASLWDGAKLTWFKPVIGIFIIVFLLYRWLTPAVRTLPIWTYAPLGLVTGFLGVFVGATGPFIAPFFLRDDLEKEEVVGTKAACQMVLHLLKVPAFFALGFAYREHLALMLPSIAAVIAGNLFGKKILSRLPGDAFVTLFQVVLLAAATQLIVSSF